MKSELEVPKNTEWQEQISHNIIEALVENHGKCSLYVSALSIQRTCTWIFNYQYEAKYVFMLY